MKIGLISDTHGSLPAEVFQVFKGVDAIVHAGDIGAEDIIVELQVLAPVYAVYGNVDDFKLRQVFPLWRMEQLGGKHVLVTHIIAPLTPIGLQHALEKIGCPQKPDILVYGHTHELCIQKVSDILTINPGSVSQPRKGEAPSVAFLEINASGEAKCWPKFLPQH
ncbi:MAG: metallophosphoesterase [candidate division KSB1 bacterium]|nr:metallophosphoesterase [candidate division KSB1 bacterium]